MIKKMLMVNGTEVAVLASGDETLANVLRGQLGLTGTKIGCGEAQCGCCNVILDNKLVRSCVTKMSKVANGASVTTIEGVGTPNSMHPLQLAFIVHGAIQCGFCTPGFIVSAKALLDENPNASEEEIKHAIAGNLCRCTGYVQIIDSIKSVSGFYQEEEKPAAAWDGHGGALED